ncbi:MAG: SLC13 family permease, partial [Planctomycetota bacterium]
RSDAAAPFHSRAWAAIAILVALVMTISSGLLPPVTASMIAAGAMILARCCTGPQARSGVDWPILVTIGAAFGVGEAITASGLAEIATNAILAGTTSLGLTATLAAIYLITLIFTACMTNNAAAVLMFPIAIAIASHTGSSPLAFAAVVAIAASCEFSTPIGYQTNLMIMGPGGYRWLDYTRFGTPLTLIAGAICVILAPIVFA